MPVFFHTYRIAAERSSFVGQQLDARMARAHPARGPRMASRRLRQSGPEGDAVVRTLQLLRRVARGRRKLHNWQTFRAGVAVQPLRNLESARAQVLSAQAQIKATGTDIERLTVRAPVEGEVLPVNIRLGEFAAAGVLQTPLLLLGNLDALHARKDIDENGEGSFSRGWRDSQARKVLT
jgi:multidrug resistance efflux pump